MKKKVCIVAAIITIIGLIIAGVKGFKVSMQYRAHQELSVALQQDFNISDIKTITDDVFGKDKDIKIRKSGNYGQSVVVSVDEVSDEQLESFQNKINDRFGIKIASDSNSKDENTEQAEGEDQESDSSSASTIKVEKNFMPRVTLTDISKQYIVYIAIATVIILVYFAIAYKKLGVHMVLAKAFASIVCSELFYMAIIAIIRYPIDIIAIMTAIAIYVLVITYLAKSFSEQSVKK